MRYRVYYQSKAKKDLAAIPEPYRTRLRESVNALADDPRPSGTLKLSGMENLHRIRVGSYRVVYEIVDKRLVVTVIAVAERGKVYSLMQRRQGK